MNNTKVFPLPENQQAMSDQQVFEAVVEIVNTKRQWFAGESVKFPGTPYFLKETDDFVGFCQIGQSLEVVVMFFGMDLTWKVTPGGIEKVSKMMHSGVAALPVFEGSQPVTPEVAQLQAMLTDCLALIQTLQTDPVFGVTTRPAIENELRKSGARARYVVFIDIDKVHEGNEKFGYETMNAKIRTAVSIRSSDLLLKARWYSGDELIFVLAGDPDGFCERLKKSFVDQGISFTSAYKEFTGAIEDDVNALAQVVKVQKSSR